MSEATSPQEVQVPPLTAQEFVGVFTQTPQGVSAEVAKFLTATPTAAIEAVAGSEVPQALTETFIKALFGKEAPKQGSELYPAYQSIEKKLNDLLKNYLDPKKRATVMNNLEVEVMKIIQLNPALYLAVMNLSQQDRKAFLDKVIDCGMQAFGRRKLNEILITASAEASQYATLREEVSTLEQRKSKLEKEKRDLEKQHPSSNLNKPAHELEAKKQTLQRNIEQQSARKASLEQEIAALERNIVNREAALISEIRKQYPNLEESRVMEIFEERKRNDPVLGSYNDTLSKKKQDLQSVENSLSQANNDLSEIDKELARLREIQRLETEIFQISSQIAEKEGRLNEARVALLKKVAEVSAQLDTVLPEAAKEALNQLQNQANEARKAQLREEARRKQEEGKKLEDQVTMAEGRVLEIITRRYSRLERRRGKVRAVTDVTLLQNDFVDLMENGVDGVVQKIINQDPELQGLSNEARQELIKRVRGKVYEEIVSEAVLHLKLDEGTLRALATSDSFIQAAENAIQKNQKIKSLIEKVTGEELTGKNALRKAWEKLPVGGLLGVIGLVLFGGWLLLAGAGKTKW